MAPPILATPMTIARAPRLRASAGDSLGRPVVTVARGWPHSPTHLSAAQSRRPNAVLAKCGSVVSPRKSRYGDGSCRAGVAAPFCELISILGYKRHQVKQACEVQQ